MSPARGLPASIAAELEPGTELLGAANLCGRFGARVAHHSFELFGFGILVCVGLAALALGITVTGRSISHIGVRVIGALMMAAGVAGLQGLILPWTGPVPEMGGGLVGMWLGNELFARFGSVGSVLVLLLGFGVGAFVALDIWALIVALWTGRAMMEAGRRSGTMATGLVRTVSVKGIPVRMPISRRENDLDDDETVPGRRKGTPAVAAAATGRRKKKKEEIEAIDESAGGIGGVEAFDPDEEVVDEEEEWDEEAPEDEEEWEEEDEYEYEDDEEEPEEAEEDVEYEYVDEEEEDEDADAPEEADAEAVPVSEAEDEEDSVEAVAEGDEEDTPGAPQVFTEEALRDKISKLPLRFAAVGQQMATEESMRDIQSAVDIENYAYPPLDLLVEPEANFSTEMEKYVREQAENLERALREYKIAGEVVGIESGPVITLFEVRLAPGTKVARLSAVSSDLARALKAINIRIVANMAGRDTVGIEVPNLKKEKVRLKELMSDPKLTEGMRLPMFLGKDASGDPLIGDLAAMPHLLIAGTTGSGKSVCMNAVIMSFLYTRKPNELKLVLVDPKMVELSQFKDIPHLMCPVVTEMSRAAAILEWAVGKMEERYELLAEAGCRDIASYNSLDWEDLKEAFDPQTEEQEARIPKKLPYMVFIIDELADLMMTNKEVEHSIVRIAQKARAVGIHLIIATQRPQANVVTGLIKSNLPARISFKVASGMDSRIVLDQKGGELLLGQGDMLYLSPRSSKLMRAQGTLVDDKEIRKAVRFIKEVAGPSFERQLMQIKGDGTTEVDSRNGLLAAQEDPLFDKAVELVLESKRGSVSMLQRSLAIGYTRAARLIEMMGEAGLIGEYKGTVAREVSMTVEEWHAIKEQWQRDAATEEAALEDSGEQGELFESEEESSDASVTGDEVLEATSVEEAEVTVAAANAETDEDAPPMEPAAATPVAESVVEAKAPAPPVEDRPFAMGSPIQVSEGVTPVAPLRVDVAKEREAQVQSAADDIEDAAPGEVAEELIEDDAEAAEEEEVELPADEVKETEAADAAEGAIETDDVDDEAEAELLADEAEEYEDDDAEANTEDEAEVEVELLADEAEELEDEDDDAVTDGEDEEEVEVELLADEAEEYEDEEADADVEAEAEEEVEAEDEVEVELLADEAEEYEDDDAKADVEDEEEVEVEFLADEAEEYEDDDAEEDVEDEEEVEIELLADEVEGEADAEEEASAEGDDEEEEEEWEEEDVEEEAEGDEEEYEEAAEADEDAEPVAGEEENGEDSEYEYEYEYVEVEDEVEGAEVVDGGDLEVKASARARERVKSQDQGRQAEIALDMLEGGSDTESDMNSVRRML